MTDKTVRQTVAFEVVVDMAARSFEDETGAHVDDIRLEYVTVDGQQFYTFDRAAKYMDDQATKGDWE